MTEFRETLEVEGWIWMPVGPRGYMIDAENQATRERVRILVGNEAYAREETLLLRALGFVGKCMA